MAAAAKSKEIALPEQTSSIVALALPEEQVAAIREALNATGEEFSLFDLATVKVPSGGTPVWTVPTLHGDQMTPTIEAVIIAYQKARVYYSTPFGEESGQPPSCASIGGEIGAGDPGGECAECHLSRFVDRTPPQCQERREMLLLTPYGNAPIRLSVPPSSLKAVRSRLTAMASEGLKYWTTTVSFGLVKTKNRDGIDYCQIAMQIGRTLTPSEQARVDAFRASSCS